MRTRAKDRRLKQRQAFTKRLFIALGCSFVVLIITSIFTYILFFNRNTKPAEPIPVASQVSTVCDDQLLAMFATVDKTQLPLWTERVKKSVEFDLFKTAVMRDNVVLLKHYWPLITASAAKYSLDPWFLASILWCESAFRKNVPSGTGPLGIAQIGEAMGEDEHLVEKGDEYKIVKVGKGKKAKTMRVKTGRKIIVRDDRLDPEKAVPVSAKVLRAYLDHYGGDMGLASLAYHSGFEGSKRAVRLFVAPKEIKDSDMKNYGLTYFFMFFNANPYSNPATYAYLHSLPNYAELYPFRVIRGIELLKLYDDPKTTKDFTVLANQYAAAQGVDAKARYWLWYRADVGVYNTPNDLVQGFSRGELVEVPNNSALGFTLRTDGDYAIGSFDENIDQRLVYRRTRPETVGVLMCLSGVIQCLRQQRGMKPLVLDVTSLSRDLVHQKSKFPESRMPMHCLALAFDVTQKGLTDDEQGEIEFVLFRMQLFGLVSYIVEKEGGQYNAYHVVAPPHQAVLETLLTLYKRGLEVAEVTKR